MTPRAYYNDNNPYAAQGLRNLISAGHIAPGDVDERSIVDVQPDDLIGYCQCHFFAGIGGWSLALRIAGWPDDRPAWTGSDSCQPWSVAGKGLGVEDDRFFWPYLGKLIAKRRPATFFGEQSAAAAEWIRIVRGDLEAMGYAVGVMPIEAACKGAKHQRDRAWILADTERHQQPREEPCSGSSGRVGRLIEPFPWHEPWQSALSRFRIVGDGLPRSVGATDAARNAIVPQVAAEVIGAYMDSTPTKSKGGFENV